MTDIPRPIGGWRSTPVVVFAAAILIVLVGIGVIVQTDASYREARRDFARSQAQLLAVSAAAAVDFNDTVAAQEAVNPLRVVATVRSASVYGRDGQLIAGYDRSGEAVPAAEQTMAASKTSNITQNAIVANLAGS